MFPQFRPYQKLKHIKLEGSRVWGLCPLFSLPYFCTRLGYNREEIDWLTLGCWGQEGRNLCSYPQRRPSKSGCVKSHEKVIFTRKSSGLCHTVLHLLLIFRQNQMKGVCSAETQVWRSSRPSCPFSQGPRWFDLNIAKHNWTNKPVLTACFLFSCYLTL